MADILLQKPVAGQSITLTPQSEDRLVFEFNSADATLTRTDNNLVMSFEDGASVNLTDFYVAYTSENMPTFLIEGAEVGGEAFFAALSEELMPAAGNTSSPLGSGTSVGFEGGELLGGVGRTDGLDSDTDAPQQAPVPQNIVQNADAGTGPASSEPAGTGVDGGNAGTPPPVDYDITLGGQAEHVTVTPLEPPFFTCELDFSGEGWRNNDDLVTNKDLDDSSNLKGLTLSSGKLMYKDKGEALETPELVTGERDVSDTRPGESYSMDIHQRSNWAGSGVDGGGIGVAGGDESWSELGYEHKNDGTEFSEAIIIDLPEGEVAYGVNIELDNLYSTDKGYDSVDEEALVQFYLNGVLQTSITVTGSLDGSAFVNNPDINFDRIVISAVDNGAGRSSTGNWHLENNSDFFVKNLTFVAPPHDVAEASGQVTATALDGFEQFFFEGLSIAGTKVSIGADGTVDTDTMLSIDGHDVTLSLDTATNTLVGQADGKDQFTFTLDPESGEWTMVQHESFSEEITLSIGGVDSNGSTDSLDINITPASADNTHTGDSTANTIDGGISDEILMGLGGDDTLNGNEGNDDLYGGAGNDLLSGGLGDDFLSGGAGSDSLQGGLGNDVITFDVNDVLVLGGTDDDGHGGDLSLDVLIGNLGDKAAVIDKMEDGSISGMEMVVFGDGVEGKDSAEIFQEIGLSKNENDEVVVSKDDWSQGNTQNIGGKEFMEFNNVDNDITILVETTKLESGSF